LILEPSMNRFIPIVATPLVRVGRFDHPEGLEHCDPSEEVSDCHSVSFVERGGFALQAKRREWRMVAGMILASGPGEVYRCRHQERHPSDVCLTVGFDPAFAEEAAYSAGRPANMGLRIRRPANRLAYLKLLLDQALSQPAGTLATELLAGEIVGAAWGDSDEPQRPFRAGQLAWYAGRVRAACDLFQREFAEDHSLSSLGRRFGMSPFHFARVFRELAGTPPHRYLLGVRLGEAARRLGDGASVTDACFASGFSHLSHFGRLFQRRFGVLPSQYPQTLGAPR
ncbi:MAG: helix-turn-helix domain-containing protein, partial [Terriglobales bacterium]